MTTFFISRHPGALAWALQQGLSVDRHVNHLDPEQVQAGDTVIGTLPVNLAARVCQRGAQFFNLSLDLPAPWRGRELSPSELRQCNARLEGFEITPTAFTPAEFANDALTNGPNQRHPHD